MRSGIQNINLPDADVRVQGSSLRNPNAKDIDIAVVVNSATYRNLVTQRFNGKVRKNGKPIDIEKLSDNDLRHLANDIELDEINRTGIYNHQARGLKYAILNGKINREDVPGLRKLRDDLRERYGDMDISVMTKNGELELNPYLKIE